MPTGLMTPNSNDLSTGYTNQNIIHPGPPTNFSGETAMLGSGGSSNFNASGRGLSLATRFAIQKNNNMGIVVLN